MLQRDCLGLFFVLVIDGLRPGDTEMCKSADLVGLFDRTRSIPMDICDDMFARMFVCIRTLRAMTTSYY